MGFPVTCYPTTSSSFLELTGSSRPAMAPPDLSPLLLKDVRVTTSMHHTPDTILNNRPELRQKICTLSTTSHKRESATLKPIFFHCLIEAKKSSLGL